MRRLRIEKSMESVERRAFTLIELLVVIAVIAVLAAILFPVFAQAREKARQTVCISNQRQIALGFRLYTQDFDEAYPNLNDPYLWVGRRWRWPVTPYLGTGQKAKSDGSFNASSGTPSILICPSDTLSGTGFDATSYGYSACFYHTPAQINAMRLGNLRQGLADPGPGQECTTQSEAAVAFPAQKVLIAEWYNSHQQDNGKRIGYWGTLAGPRTPGPDRWQGARNYALSDGHTKFLPARRIRPSADDCPDIHLTPDGVAGHDLE
jgi:prepilin-type N-terminal cleavage/methylation domain-containing protein